MTLTNETTINMTFTRFNDIANNIKTFFKNTPDIHITNYYFQGLSYVLQMMTKSAIRRYFYSNLLMTMIS